MPNFNLIAKKLQIFRFSPFPPLNDLRPVALTSIAMKCMEKIVLNHILSCLSPVQDPFQFAYRANRSVEDAILFFL